MNRPCGLVRVEIKYQDQRSPHWWAVRTCFFKPEEVETQETRERLAGAFADARFAVAKIIAAECGS